MNRTAKEMTTLPLTLLQELVKAAAAELAAGRTVHPLKGPAHAAVRKTYHRNHVRRDIEVLLWEDGAVLAGYSFTDKRTGRAIERGMLIRGQRWHLKVGTVGDGGFRPDWENIRKLEGEMVWGYDLALTGKLK